MKGRLNIFILIMVIFFSCGYDSYEKQEIGAQQAFDLNTSSNQKQLVKDFLEGSIKFSDRPCKITGGFYCLWKRQDIDIAPHIALNDMFIREGYEITTKKDSLNFIIISERISHKVGTYTNGGDALKTETIISAINLKNDTAYIIDKNIGSDPPSSNFSRVGSGSVSSGSSPGDEDIFDFLKTIVIKQ